MKNILFVLTLFGIISCQTPNVIIESNGNNGLEPGACYFTLLQDFGDKKEKPFVLEFVPPKYEEVEVIYTASELEAFATGSDMYSFEIRKPHYNFVFKGIDIADFTTKKNPNGFMFCKAEIASMFWNVTKERLSENKNKVSIYKVVSHSKIIKKYAKKKPEKLKENQYYFEGGYWTKPKKAVGTSF